jgi:hypothetical protein
MVTEDNANEGETLAMDTEELDVEEHEDGSATLKLDDEDEKREQSETQLHFANIVEDVDPKKLSEAVSDLIDKLDKDKEAREKRDKLYEEGLRRTGLGDDAPGGAQFTGATRVVHPMLIEACVDFSARVMKELFPATGPVKSKILGQVKKDKLAKARRKTDYLNWQATEQMQEFRGELEQLTTQVPLGGGQYLKVRYNKQRRRPVVEFVPIDDILLPFAATNFYTADRKAQVQYITAMEYQRRVKSGMYIDADLGTAEDPEYSKASKANDKIEGRTESSYNEDGLRTVFEIYTYLDIEDDEVAPYILTVDKSTEKALSLYRNWDKEDTTCEALDWIVEFPFVPWRGAYPIGLTHMIGGLSGAATGALRALLDSAHIQNMPSMLKLKGGPSGQTINILPTEVVEMEGGALIDDIRKLAMPIPFNPPSNTLFQLLGFVVDAGKGVVQTSFEKLSDQNPNMPVGTTLALIEQGLTVFSSIHARMHNSMARVLRIIQRINASYLTEEDIEAQGSGLEVSPEDFDDPMDVIPVSDPQVFSETQRFAQVQTVMQRAAAAPQMYDVRKVEELFLHSMKLPEDLLQPAPGKEDMDPVSENVAAAMGRPVYVLPGQDHMAHLQLHMAFLKSPMFGQNPAIVKTYLFPMAAHLRDHLLNYYLAESHEAVDQAQTQKLIPEEAQAQAQVILQVQQAIEQSLQGFEQMLGQIDQEAQKYKPQPPVPPDSSMQVAQLNAQLQGQALQQKAQATAAKAQTEQQRLQMQGQTEAQKLQAQAAEAEKQRQATYLREQMRLDAEQRRQQEELRVRYQMNTDDNSTAMTISQGEILTGKHSPLSTGTGINPNP